jgi:hypothetical protein
LFSSPKYADGSESHPASYAAVGEAALSDLKRLVREADRSSPSSTAVENDWIYSSIPPIYLHVVYKENFRILSLIFVMRGGHDSSLKCDRLDM